MSGRRRTAALGLVAAFSLSAGEAAAREPVPIQRHAVLRTGGWLGLLGVGGGIGLFDDRIRLTATYGFVPAAVAGDDLHELSLGVTVRAPELTSRLWRWVPLYGGATLLFTPDRDTFVVPPARYPAGYYAPTALHALTVAGTELGLRSDGLVQHAVFFELVGLARYWARWIGNQRVVGLDDVLSPAFGGVIRW